MRETMPQELTITARQMAIANPRPGPGLVRYARANTEPGLDVWVVENGLCNRVVGATSYPRLDGWDRPRYLRAHLGVVADTVAAGVPLTAYLHWTLADNYEWGSYEPRFGLYGIERSDDKVVWSDLDAMGHDAAGAYRELIARMRG